MENNKYEELHKQIEETRAQIDTLKMNVQELESDIKQYLPGKIDDILEKANSLWGKHYLYFNCYNSYFDTFYFHYCKNITLKNITSDYNVVNVKYACTEIGASGEIRYRETGTTMVTSMEDFDGYKILNEKQTNEIYDEINKTIRREQSIDVLYSFLKDMYNSIDE